LISADSDEPARGLFKALDEFIRQFDDRDIEVRPDPALDFQIRLAQDLSSLMMEYKTATRLQHSYQNTASALEIQQAHSTREKRFKIALDLEDCIREVKAQGMVHDGTQLFKKLKECQEKLLDSQEDNRKLSQQLLEYKNKLGLPKGK